MYGEDWNNLRISILKRDLMKCKLCGVKNTELHVHHLCYFEHVHPCKINTKYLVTLCRKCHTLQHKIFPKKHFYLKSEDQVTELHLKPSKSIKKNKQKTSKSKRDKLFNSLSKKEKRIQERYNKHQTTKS